MKKIILRENETLFSDNSINILACITLFLPITKLGKHLMFLHPVSAIITLLLHPSGDMGPIPLGIRAVEHLGKDFWGFFFPFSPT